MKFAGDNDGGSAIDEGGRAPRRTKFQDIPSLTGHYWPHRTRQSPLFSKVLVEAAFELCIILVTVRGFATAIGRQPRGNS